MKMIGNKNGKFYVLGVIVIFLIVIFATAKKTKNIGVDEEKNKNPITVEEVLEEKEPEKIFGYIKNEKQKIYEDIGENQEVKDTLKKGTRIEVLEYKNLEIEKFRNIKKEDGTLEKQPYIIIKEYAKIKYNKGLEEKDGWLESKEIVSDINTIVPEYLKNIDFGKIEKREYPNNPKVEVRGIYLTVNTVSSSRLDSIIEFAKRNNINAFVIDVKEDFGKMLFKTEAEEKYLGTVKKRYPISDIEALMKKLKDNNIYTIARIVSFKDPRYAAKYPEKAIINKATGKPFTNKDGLIWVSPHDRNLWEYNIAVAKEAAKVGFNEIQFDYVRFPASNGGKLDKELDYRNINNESKPETIQKYLKYARENLEPMEVYISADVYGLIGTIGNDMGLGQYWEAVSNVVDTISPMAYPSHYGNGLYGLKVPDAEPYKTLYYSTYDSINRNYNLEYPANIRPWLQAFTAKWIKGHINYGKKEIEEQIRALNELGIKEYLLWSPTNRYGMIEN